MLTTEKDRAKKKVTELTTALEEEKTELENVILESKSEMACAEEEKDRAMASHKETVGTALKVGQECFDNAIEQIRFLNPNLQFPTKSRNVRLTMVNDQLVEITNGPDDVESLPTDSEGV